MGWVVQLHCKGQDALLFVWEYVWVVIGLGVCVVGMECIMWMVVGIVECVNNMRVG